MELLNTDLTLLEQNPLFQGLSPADIRKSLYCLRAHSEAYPAKTFLFEEGDPALAMAVILQGQVDLLRYDSQGNITILESFQAGESFGEAYAVLPAGHYGVNAESRTPVRVLWLQVGPLFEEISCPFSSRLLQNLVADIAQKDLLLKGKVMVLSQKGLENKVLSFLEGYAPKEGGSFAIPFSREAMAAYLSCERSALSRLLSKMAKEGKICYQGNRFSIKRKAL